jgi:hypothetical protein
MQAFIVKINNAAHRQHWTDEVCKYLMNNSKGHAIFSRKHVF